MSGELEVFVINLKRREDRLSRMKELFPIDINIVNAFDGRELETLTANGSIGSLHKELLACLSKYDLNKKDQLAPLLGVWISHLGIWLRLYNSHEERCVIILEDDVKPIQGFNPKHFNDILRQLPKHFDIAFLGTEITREEEIKLSAINAFLHDNQPSTVRVGQEFHTTCAYVLSRSGATKLIDQLFDDINNKMAISSIDAHIWYHQPQLLTYKTLPQLVVSIKEDFISDIQGA